MKILHFDFDIATIVGVEGSILYHNIIPYVLRGFFITHSHV